jgi:hypothetical protein
LVGLGVLEHNPPASTSVADTNEVMRWPTSPPAPPRHAPADRLNEHVREEEGHRA